MTAITPGLRVYSNQLIAERAIYLDRSVRVDPGYPEYTWLQDDLEAFSHDFDGIDIRHAYDPINGAQHVARVDIATRKQIERRADALGGLGKRDLMRALADNETDLTDNIGVLAEGVRERVNPRTGEGFIHVTLDDESVDELNRDFKRSWEILAELGEAPVERFTPGFFHPDVRVAYVSGDLTERDRDRAMIKMIEMIDASIEDGLYMLLGPVVDLGRLKPR